MEEVLIGAFVRMDSVGDPKQPRGLWIYKVNICFDKDVLSSPFPVCTHERIFVIPFDQKCMQEKKEGTYANISSLKVATKQIYVEFFRCDTVNLNIFMLYL